ncbi:PEP-CTERM sorting domain-containing protein [Aeoliella sp. SH292]|uniref:PEP-CTERM sorting domain-containing protein n=1 Tax=Aeoliella sp. SH292 TaxID=3454464 RepID=UPI003F9E9AA9
MSFSKNILSIALAVVSASAAATVKADQFFDFGTPIMTGPSQAAGVWYTDRYAPAGFTASVFFDTDERLQQSISATDGADSRPGAFSSAFYNTQGRKYDLEVGTGEMSIQLYIPSTWETSNARMAGFWGTGFDDANAVSAYPILEFTSEAANPRFRGYDNGVWIDLGLPTGFAYDTWQELGISLLPSGEIEYTVGDISATTTMLAGNGTTSIGNVILQGHNSQIGVSYDIYWDNLSTTVIPEPSTIAMLGLAGVVGLAMVRRRQG